MIQQGTAGSLHVTLSIQDDQKHPAVGFIITPSSVDIPLAEGSVRFEPVLVQPGTTALEGSYGLRISADGLRRFRVPFRLRDAQGLTASVAEALAALNEATDEKLALDDARTGVKLAQKREALRKCQKELKAKQQYIPSNVAKGSLHQMQKQCQQHLDALRPARSEREHRMDQHPLHQQLLAVRGVMGFLHDFVFVEDDNDARLLSWMAKDKLQTLVVDTYETSEAVLRAYPAFTGRMLPLELADNLKPLILPHTGNLSGHLFMNTVMQHVHGDTKL